MALAISSLPTPLSPRRDDAGVGARHGLDGLIDLLHGGAGADQPVKGGTTFDLLDEAAAFEFERALFDGAEQNDFEFVVVERKEKEFVGAGLAGFQREWNGCWFW